MSTDNPNPKPIDWVQWAHRLATLGLAAALLMGWITKQQAQEIVDDPIHAIATSKLPPEQKKKLIFDLSKQQPAKPAEQPTKTDDPKDIGLPEIFAFGLPLLEKYGPAFVEKYWPQIWAWIQQQQQPAKPPEKPPVDPQKPTDDPRKPPTDPTKPTTTNAIKIVFTDGRVVGVMQVGELVLIPGQSVQLVPSPDQGSASISVTGSPAPVTPTPGPVQPQGPTQPTVDSDFQAWRNMLADEAMRVQSSDTYRGTSLLDAHCQQAIAEGHQAWADTIRQAVPAIGRPPARQLTAQEIGAIRGVR